MDKITMSRNVEFEIPVQKKYKYEHRAPTDFKIMAFPDEVLLRIFKNLSTFDILRQIPPVCQRFYRLSKDPTLITEVTVENLRWWEVDPRVGPRPGQLRRSPRRTRFNDTVYDVIRRSKNLVSLSIESRPDFYALLRVALENCPKFNRFRLIEKRLYDYDIVHDLQEVLRKSNIFF